MTHARALSPGPAPPETPDRTGAGAESDIPSFPEVLGALLCSWSRKGTLPTSTLPWMQADDAVSGEAWDIVDEWGLQSFPASDPPSNW